MISRLAANSCVMYLVRHGATDNNVARPPRLQGRRSDPGLSVEGRLQAARTAALLSACELGAVCSSPLRRARETAEAIADPHGITVKTVDEITEVDVGQWEGRTWDQIERSDPDAYRRFIADAATYGYVGGENFDQVQQRVMPALCHLLQSHRGMRIAVVAHNVVNRVFLAHLMGLSTSLARGISQDNCGVNVIRLRDDEMKLRTLNAVFHLDDATDGSRPTLRK